ncbi:hypothetical protein BLL42_21350 [Pseudomonas frederiksbergensis]|uniref:Uncharacterized protein n=2 Tax=Pseudomonas frederiksbergensis TaxID=104087 RepID=A0A1J0ET62_9PSED|nr:hypothetical protein BLL42_21350 [Pseudomonas frederiksbergensis]
MHPAIQLANDVRKALRQRSHIAIADFYELIGQPVPGAPPRFVVRMAGKAFFHVVDSRTGKVRGFRRNHNEACALARQLEEKE